MSDLGKRIMDNMVLYAKAFTMAYEAFTAAGLDKDTALAEARMVAYSAVLPDKPVATERVFDS